MKQQKARILLAEDNITNQQVTMAVLENLGLQADAVANGQEAITALTAHAYDLVLMDCQMPVLDGYDATRLIRQGASTADNHRVPIIAMTAHARQSERDRCLQCGMDDFLTKPVLPQALAIILAKWLPADREHPAPIAAPHAPGAALEEPASLFPVWDRQGMLDRLLGDQQVAQTIVQCFLTDLPLQLQALHKSLVACDLLAVERQAHSIKGAAAIVGGTRLQALALALEQLAANPGQVAALHSQLKVLQEEFARLQQAMQQEPLPHAGIVADDARTTATSRPMQGAQDEDTDR